ncbi:unnamed protein product [Cochlearia groenlandica]
MVKEVRTYGVAVLWDKEGLDFVVNGQRLKPYLAHEDEEELTRGFNFPFRTEVTPLVRDTEKLPSPRELYDALMEAKFEPSFFPDTLTKLGILDEVRMINMGIGNALGMSYDAYQEETCMFLANLEVVLDDRGSQEAQNTGGCSIRVTDANKITHRATFRAIAELYGFTILGVHELVNEPGESNKLWNFVANGVSEQGRSKSSQICHIAVRYV